MTTKQDRPPVQKSGPYKDMTDYEIAVEEDMPHPQRRYQKNVVVAAVKFAILTATFTIATMLMLSFFE
jgi:hypothetical protein